MPEIRVSDLKELFDASLEKFNERFPEVRIEQSLNEAYFEALSEQIFIETKSSITGSWLYKKVHLNIPKIKSGGTIRLRAFQLNVLTRYAYGSDFSERFEFIERNNVELVNKKISEGVYNNPEVAEYPVRSPSFPATPTIRIEIEGFENCYIKNEGENPRGGTHKSRAAWEIYIYARNKYSELINANVKNPKITLAVLSTGSFAISIYNRLNDYGITFDLHAIFDPQATDTKVQETFQKLSKKGNFIPIPTDLEAERLDSQKIERLVGNDCIDVTFGSQVLEIKDKYYDWLAYEILNQSPDVVIVPFGSGDLYIGILEVLRKETEKVRSGKQVSKRFFGNLDQLNDCEFIGVTTFSMKSAFDKLYSPRPFHPATSLDLSPYFENEVVSPESRIIEVGEKKLSDALAIAEKYNVATEPSGIAGLCWFLDNKNRYGSRQKILIVNTGKLRLDRIH